MLPRVILFEPAKYLTFIIFSCRSLDTLLAFFTLYLPSSFRVSRPASRPFVDSTNAYRTPSPQHTRTTYPFFSGSRTDTIDRARLGKHIVGHYPWATETSVRRAATAPVRSDQPQMPSLKTAASAPADEASGASLPSPHPSGSPRPPTPEVPDQPVHPDVDLESGSEVPIQRQHRWKPGRRAERKPRQHSEATSRAHQKSSYELLKIIVFSSWANVLLVFIPVGIALHFVHVNPTVVFIMNFLAIIPLAGVSSVPPFFPFRGLRINSINRNGAKICYSYSASPQKKLQLKLVRLLADY